MGNLLCVANDPGARQDHEKLCPVPQSQVNQGVKASNPESRSPPPQLLPQTAKRAASPPQQVQTMDHPESLKITCREAVLTVFPDICPEFLLKASEEKGHDFHEVISHVLDQSEDGKSYPKRPRTNLKRKRTEDGAEQANDSTRRFDNDERRREQKTLTYLKTSKILLQQGFPLVAVRDLYATFSQNGQCLYPTFMAMDKIMSEYDERDPPFTLKKRPIKENASYLEDAIEETIQNCEDVAEKEALIEFHEARKARAILRAEADAKLRHDLAEADNFNHAKAEGTVTTCECCCDDFALNRMVHCNAEKCHFFCYDCARRMAENEIGLSKYELGCMSMDGCQAGFARDQRDLFLDQNAAIALERIEQEAVLRLAGIENLETCPFCPFAAEYPPVEVDKEFRCQNPECEFVSCRLCRQETHIPKSCEEAKRENGLSARREIEEAMSAALIRTCNKCGTPFIKENGCNKMTCTRAGCMNVQCYVCSKSCDYSHFDDTSRGGKQGNCPLFDSVEQRHEAEVRAAEEAARKKVEEQNPDVDHDMLQIKVSKTVKADEEARRNRKEREFAGFHARNRVLNPPAAPGGPPNDQERQPAIADFFRRPEWRLQPPPPPIINHPAGDLAGALPRAAPPPRHLANPALNVGPQRQGLGRDELPEDAARRFNPYAYMDLGRIGPGQPVQPFPQPLPMAGIPVPFDYVNGNRNQKPGRRVGRNRGSPVPAGENENGAAGAAEPAAVPIRSGRRRPRA